MADVERLIDVFSSAPQLDRLPAVVDVRHGAPPNPPVDLQERATGAVGEAVYRDAASFVRVARQWCERHGEGGELPVIDFGSGWGRICRFLLADTPPEQLYALDADPAMTALTQSSLPGVQSLTVPLMPPTALRDQLAATVTAFSVFSHLPPHAHEAWAVEIGRLTRPGGMAIITLLDDAVFDEIRQTQDWVSRGETAELAVGLAASFPDADEAQERFERGELVFAGVPVEAPLDPELYGWAVAPPSYVRSAWGQAGFDVCEWVPSGVLFPQAMVGLRKR